MRIDSISTNSFQGNVRYMKLLGEREKQFAREIMSYGLDGISNREILAKKGFDIEFYGSNIVGIINQTLRIYPCIKYIISDGPCKGKSNTNYNPIDINMNEGIEGGAKILRNHIKETEKFMEKYYPTHYYNGIEYLKAKLKVLFGNV